MSTATILFYHSVSDHTDHRIDPSIVVSPANFERQLAYLSRRRHVMALPDLVDAIRSHKPIAPGSVVITFDDGYRDNLTTVYPLLKHYGLPAAFFLATGFIGARQAKWEDRLSFAIQYTTRTEIALEGNTFPLATPAARADAFNQVVARLSRLAPPERAPLTAQLEAQTGTAPEQFPANVMLTWDEARTMAADPLLTFGAHTVLHERLSLLPDDAVRAEINESRKTVEAELGRAAPFFAYPYGTSVDFDQRAVDALQAGGFAGALTTLYATNDSSSDPLRLGRVIGADSAGLRFSLGTALRASPAGPLIRRAANRLKGSA